MTANVDSFDLDAAVLRASATDLKALLSALAARLEGALPARVKVERKREGLLSGAKYVASISLDAGEAIYVIALERAGVRTTRAKTVRGVVISTSTLQPGVWLAEVRGQVSRLAAQAGDTGDLLHDFL